MISVRNVRKVYPTRTGPKLVFEGVNFELNKGERLGILDRKSTRLNSSHIQKSRMPSSA